MFVSVLEGLHQPQSLVHRSSHWKIIHGDLPQDAFAINDEESSERDASKTYCKLFLIVNFYIVVKHICPLFVYT